MLKYNKRHYPAIAEIPIDLDYTLIEDFLWENYDQGFTEIILLP